MVAILENRLIFVFGQLQFSIHDRPKRRQALTILPAGWYGPRVRQLKNRIPREGNPDAFPRNHPVERTRIFARIRFRRRTWKSTERVE